MNKWTLVFLGSLVVLCIGREPFKAKTKSLPFMVHYTSRYRGLCAGMLVARSVVLTAGVCVINPLSPKQDTRPITVVVGTWYRHPRRGIRVPVTKILKPKMSVTLAQRAYLLQQSSVVMLLKKRIPDIITEVPLRALEIQYNYGDDYLVLQEECMLTGWHFFYEGDKIYPVHKFLLQRNVRAQFVNYVKMHEWCDALHIKLLKALSNVGFSGVFDDSSMICVKDGMYGAPLICKGYAVGMLNAPDGQWVNCTGHSNLIHLFNSEYTRKFFDCVSRLFLPDFKMSWDDLKKSVYDDLEDIYDYIPAIYDRVIRKSESTSSSEEL